MKHFRSRHEAVREIKKRIRNPRRDMLLIVLVTGTAGFWISYALLLVGIEDEEVKSVVAIVVEQGDIDIVHARDAHAHVLLHQFPAR